MNQTVKKLLAGEGGNHILPFFWQHGEDEATLREYMEVIQKSGCGAVCVESRPHPDFCGPKWWADLDVVLDEAKRRNMKVWILDDSHFPTGYANGAMENAPQELCRQGVCGVKREYDGGEAPVELDALALIPPKLEPIGMEAFILPTLPEPRHYTDDSLLSVTAVGEEGQTLDLTGLVREGVLRWEKPAGRWAVWVVGLSRNCGTHRNYINMLDQRSCRKLIEAVYEPHWERYRQEFGKTIAGFFSDEPELGNGHLYFMESKLGTEQDLPFSGELPGELEKRLGPGWMGMLRLLWDNGGDPEETARVRYAYMDAVTKLVREDFSRQIGGWCREHGVEYIGHVIEDNNAHARPGPSLGHYFRGLDGQHMSGVDVISDQVSPQMTGARANPMGILADGEFYQFTLAKLASSAAAIEPQKRGRALCELFGAYGWKEGVRLEKYLVDHCLVRGINQFVPHAFTPAPFPDPDCPPHFYAHGHNPQYRHFGELMRYTNRAAELLSSGPRKAPVALLYHGEAEWAGEAMLDQKPARALMEAQIDFDIIPCDVFSEREHYQASLGGGLRVNGREYAALVVPYAQFVPEALARGVEELAGSGTEVAFLEGLPQGISQGDPSARAALEKARVLPLEELAEHFRSLRTAVFQPEDPWLRAAQIQGDSDVYFLVNEGEKAWEGEIVLPQAGPCYGYDPYENRVFALNAREGDGAVRISAKLEPFHSLTVVFGQADVPLDRPWKVSSQAQPLTEWKRSQCEGAEYPRFQGEKSVALPDRLAEEQPEFSGFVRYETSFRLPQGKRALLEITDAAEGVEVFVNGKSAGLQIVPPFRYDLSDLAVSGENRLAIEVATTLERECCAMQDTSHPMMMAPPPTAQSGLTGAVALYLEEA